jgi:hypothetical protein
MNDDPTTFSTVMGMVMHAEAERARQEELAAVLTFLRAEFDTDSVREAADCIERGEHRREEGA